MTHQAVFKIVVFGALVAVGTQRASAQQVPPIAPTASVGSSRGGAPNSTVGPYVSSTLPTTGHATRFKQYAGEGFGQSTGGGSGQQGGGSRRSPISPYLALTGGGDAAANYFLGVQPLQQLNNVGSQTSQINTQLGGLRRDVRAAAPPPVSVRSSLAGQQTPLQRQVIQQQQANAPTTGADTFVLQEILKELKAIREHVAPVKDKLQD